MAHPLEPRLLTTKEAAELLRVSPRTVLNWIERDSVPYVALPHAGGRRREYRIPLHGLLRSVAANFDLSEEFAISDQAMSALQQESPAPQSKSVAEHKGLAAH
jgi:excisionase family DNA binding protein